MGLNETPTPPKPDNHKTCKRDPRRERDYPNAYISKINNLKPFEYIRPPALSSLYIKFYILPECDCAFLGIYRATTTIRRRLRNTTEYMYYIRAIASVYFANDNGRVYELELSVFCVKHTRSISVTVRRRLAKL